MHRRPRPTRVPAPRPLLRTALLGLALLGVPAVAPPVAAQEQAVRTGPVQGDTLSPDTLAADTLARDTTLTPRERAIQRLRAMPRTPVQPDPADSLAADSLAADSLVADSLAPGDPAAGLPPGVVVPDSLREDTTRLRPEPPDTGGVPLAPGIRLPTEDSIRADTAGPVPMTRAGDPGAVLEADVRAALGALEGYVTTEYEGQSAVFQADSNRLRITGDSRIAREGSTLETDSLLVYDGGSGVICGYGQPILSGQGEDPVESDEVCFDIDRDVGMARGARTRFTQGGTWYVGGADNRVYVLTGVENTTIYGERAEFTSCDLDHPHYSFQARSLKMVDGEMMVARDVTLQFEDVPVFWLPWMVQSMKQGRRSGLLVPQFGVNDIVRNDRGYNRHLSNLGFYWAINDYASARGTFEWYSGNWTAVEGALSYYWRRQFLQGSLTAKNYWREPSGRALTLNTSNSWQPDERTRVSVNANYTSSTDFVRRNSFDPSELNQTIRSSASVNRSFDWGSVSLGADRQQQLSTEQVNMTLPSLSLSVSPRTLYTSEGGMTITWSGRGSANRQLRDVREDTTSSARDSDQATAQVSHSLSIGRLGLSQSLTYDQEVLGATSFVAEDSLVTTPEATAEAMRWSTSLSYQQGLWIGTTVSPNISISGRQVRNDSTRAWIDRLGAGGTGDWVPEPLRVSAGASLSTAIYGFWPGFASFSRIRHKIAPSISWSYSPAPGTTALQDSVFGVRNLREQNRVTLSFSQTFEGKVRESEEAAADTAVAAEPGEPGEPGEPRRLPQAEKMEILALNTSTSFVYDFVAAREEGRGFQTEEIRNSIRSDLLRGLQLSMTHDLFDEGVVPGSDGVAPRTFSPYLTRLSASFSIDNDFWLLGLLGLTPDRTERRDTAQDTVQESTATGAEADPDRMLGGVGAVIPGGADRTGGDAVRQGVGRWQAQLSYSLNRNRPGVGTGGGSDSQLLQGRLSFDPTEHWSVTWNTAYSFTDGDFTNHYLTLSRDLHRWQANFDFIKAQNGNFAMQFRVQLRDNPDLKLDYDQRERVQPAPPVQ